MRVFVTGATGFIGAAVIRELVGAGHQVLGLARSQAAADWLARAGVEAQLGELDDADALRAGALAADAVMHLAFNNDFSQFQQSCETDRLAIEAIASAIARTGKRLVVPNGIAGLARSGELLTEDDGVPADYRFPRVSEQTGLRLASEGVAVSVVRLAQVHDVERQGLVTRLVAAARQRGESGYVGDGLHRWSAVHVSDAAHLLRLVAETGEAGARYHAVAEQGVELRAVAEAIGRALDVPTRSLEADEAQAHFQAISMFVTEDMQASSAVTRARTGWTPSGPTLIADLERIGGRTA